MFTEEICQNKVLRTCCKVSESALEVGQIFMWMLKRTRQASADVEIAIVYHEYQLNSSDAETDVCKYLDL